MAFWIYNIVFLQFDSIIFVNIISSTYYIYKDIIYSKYSQKISTKNKDFIQGYDHVAVYGK